MLFRSLKWGKEDIDIIDAGGMPASVIKGGSVCEHTISFGMIRGDHIDITVLGTLQVDQEGNYKNYRKKEYFYSISILQGNLYTCSSPFPSVHYR